MNTALAILEPDGTVTPVDNLEQWAVWYKTDADNRRIGLTKFNGEDIVISTVFLGIDHSFAISSKPIWFKTMVFGGDMDGFTKRYTTIEDARAGHYATVETVKLTEKLTTPTSETLR